MPTGAFTGPGAGSLYGWLVGQLGSDLLVYHRSEVHFAPVHPAEIAVYDLRNKRDDTIFPPKTPTAIRQARATQLLDFYKASPEWCRKNDVLYVYRRLGDPAKMEFREMLWSDAQTQFGDVPLQDVLQPEMLQKIFGESPPNPKP